VRKGRKGGGAVEGIIRASGTGRKSTDRGSERGEVGFWKMDYQGSDNVRVL